MQLKTRLPSLLTTTCSRVTEGWDALLGSGKVLRGEELLRGEDNERG